MKAYLKEWYAKHPEKRKLYQGRIDKAAVKEKHHQEYVRNREKYRERAKKAYAKNAETIKAKVREWRLKNLEHCKRVKAEYRRKNKAILAAKQKARYHDYYRPVAQEYKKKNAARIKEWTTWYRTTYKEELLARQREYRRTMDQAKKRDQESRYRANQRKRKMELELSLLSGLLASKASRTSSNRLARRQPKS